ncbi:hypothetical protein CPB83DRAFT_899976 [Crepidotus variabilis]|uniref:Uncharacterized protein n=1 Tax=Crepidotus variabilis TaxID=179855 RepID=A0A9P6E430_9AGAR|nr:hypothetical protein CPB83DRAFT_899976 [Crepidotus variabilis]
MLERSRTTDIVVEVDLCVAKDYHRRAEIKIEKVAFLEHIFKQHASRILNLHVISSIYQNIPSFPPSTPRLQILDLYHHASGTNIPHFPTLLLSASPLEELRLEGYKVDWTNFTFPGLKTLALKYIRPFEGSTSVIPFIEALQRTRRLQMLHINCSLPKFIASEDLSAVAPVELLSLRELYLEDSQEGYNAKFLSCLRIPSVTLVEVE